MISFESDYTTGAHPKILQRFIETNLESAPGYGSDKYCDSAKEKIREAVGISDADIYFISGGTQTNQLVISTVLDNYAGVVAADTGHVSGHEAGAIEYSRHKIITIKGYDGKIKAFDLEDYFKTFYADGNHSHMVQPGMVYISFPTEYGTLYSKQELTDIYKVCCKYDAPLFIDGARLGYALASKENDISLKELAGLCDVFYIGGTKVGALCGEALVFTKNNTPSHYITQIKQHGALMAKGRLFGVQFDTLFTDDLYMEISKNAIDRAEELKNLFKEKGYKFFLNSPTNQQFIILSNVKLKELSENVRFSFWEKYDDDHTVVRFATSWSTTKEDIDVLATLL